MTKIMLGGLAALLLLASAILWMLRPGRNGGRQAAPAFSLQDQNGQTHRLRDYAGVGWCSIFIPRMTRQAALRRPAASR